jgi:FkbM family methyltransferase
LGAVHPLAWARSAVPEPVRRLGRRRREARRRERLLDVEPTIVERSYGGVPLHVAIQDTVARDWYGSGWPVLPEIELLRTSQLRSGALVVDVGAHQGVLAMILARAAGTDGRVIAVEPSEHNVRVARENLARNCVANVEVVEAVATARPGTARFDGGLNGRVGVGTEVTAVTVDGLLYGRRVDVVVIDVEGHETQVLAGARAALAADPPADWFVEVHVGCGLEASGGSVDELLACFSPERYALHMSDGTQYGAFVPFDRHHPMTRSRFYLVALPAV